MFTQLIRRVARGCNNIWKRLARQSRLRRFAQRIGYRGESAAAEYLVNAGYELLCRNYRAPHGVGELDLVLRDPAGVLCFVEVKTRRELPGRGTRPAWAVDVPKQLRLRRAGRAYQRSMAIQPRQTRFDVVEVWSSSRGTPRRLRHWPDAFGKPGTCRNPHNNHLTSSSKNKSG